MKILLLCILFQLFFGSLENEKVKIEYYVMSKCPDYQRLINKVFYEITNELEDIIDFSPNYIATYDPSEKYNFKSLHGTEEVLGDLYEICVHKMYGTKVFNEFTYCLNPKMRSIPTNVEECLNQLKLNVDEVNECALGEKGKNYLWSSVNQTTALKIRWCPTVFIDSEFFCEYDDPKNCKVEPNNVEEWIKTICDQSEASPKPQACYD